MLAVLGAALPPGVRSLMPFSTQLEAPDIGQRRHRRLGRAFVEIVEVDPGRGIERRDQLLGLSGR